MSALHEDYLRVDELADFLGLKEDTVQRYLKQGKVPYTRILGRPLIVRDVLKQRMTELSLRNLAPIQDEDT